VAGNHDIDGPAGGGSRTDRSAQGSLDVSQRPPRPDNPGLVVCGATRGELSRGAGVRRAACRVEGTAPRRTGGQRAAGEWRRDVRAGLREVITVRFARSLVLCAAGASRSQVHAGGCLLAAAKTDSSSFADVHVQY
jgi:hypothetical protein